MPAQKFCNYKPGATIMRILFTCAGTAGHINPALAIADEIRRVLPEAKILFVGSGRRLEKKLIPQAGYELKNIQINGIERSLKRDMIVRNIKTIANLAASRRQAEEILRQFKPDIAVGTGGYVCYPVLKTAVRMGIPTLLHESNAVPGLTTKLLTGKVDKLLIAFPDKSNQYHHPEKVLLTGTPVRGAFQTQNKDTARLKLGVDGRPLVVSFWGSLGADKMNEIIAEFVDRNMADRAFNHIHATGGSKSVTAALKKRVSGSEFGYNIPRWIDLRTYIDNMPLVMAASDLILCRAGASTIAELTYLGKPAVIIPSPNVASNHQEKNASILANTGGAVVLSEKDCTGEMLYDTVEKLLTNKDGLAAMSEAMQHAGVRNSAEKIVKLIISMS